VKKNGFISVGKIVGVHGLNGTSKVYSYAESLSVFQPNGSILLRTATGQEKKYEIKWAKPHTRVILLALKGVTNRSQAEKLIGCELYIDKAKLPELEEGTYYWFDIIGLSVFTVDENYLGRVESIIPTGSNDVYVVKNPDKDEKNEVLIPALESVILEIDLKRQVMRVDLPEGL
jgi:16S rRNA processing protein RimM